MGAGTSWRRRSSCCVVASAVVFGVFGGCTGGTEAKSASPAPSSPQTVTTVDEEPGRCVALLRSTVSSPSAFDRVADGVGVRMMVGLGATPARSGDATALWVGNPPVIVSSTEMRLTDVEANARLDRIQGWAEEHPEEGVTVIVGPPQDDCIPDSE